MAQNNAIKNIAQFVVREYISNLKKMDYGDIKSLLTDGSRRAALRYQKYGVVVDLIDSIYNKFLKPFRPKSFVPGGVLFDIGVKYPSIILETKKKYPTVMAVKGGKDRLLAMKNFIPYINCADLYQFIYNYLIQKDEKHLYHLIESVKKKIKSINPSYIVLWNDSLPIERAIILAARELGITTIDIQHGIFQPTSVESEGRAADYIFVWGQYFKDLYIKNKLRTNQEVYILGYPYFIKDRKFQRTGKGKHTVCYLGEDFERYNSSLLDIKLETINTIYNQCKKSGLEFIYRPHPGENRQVLLKKLPGDYLTPENEKIEDVFKRADIFISFSSTALIEAATRGKICFQLTNIPLQRDNFEELGVCNKTFKSVTELENFLADSTILNHLKPKFNNSYINLSYHSGHRFLEILDDIEKNKK